jgi:isoleucyl-tRNA synthetase
MADAGYTVALETAIDSALRLEGLARELNSRIQRLRRDVGLAVSDRVRVRVGGDAEVMQAVDAHRSWLAGETLATDLSVVPDLSAHDGTVHEVDIDGAPVRVSIERA